MVARRQSLQEVVTSEYPWATSGWGVFVSQDRTKDPLSRANLIPRPGVGGMGSNSSPGPNSSTGLGVSCLHSAAQSLSEAAKRSSWVL